VSKSAFLAEAQIDHVYGGATYTRPTTVYYALFTTAPTEPDGVGGVEMTGFGYQRVAVANNPTNFPPGNPKSNGADVVFPDAIGGPWVIDGWATYDAATGGNLMHFGSFGSPTTIPAGDTARFPAGSLVLTED
jgi:hypothetical protein